MKKEIELLTNDAVLGMRDPLEVYMLLTEAEKLIKKAKEDIKDLAIEEKEKHGEKQIDFKGYHVNVTQGASYSYDHVDVYNKVRSRLKEIEKQSKIALELGENVVIESTGEVIEPAIKKYSKPALTFKAIR